MSNTPDYQAAASAVFGFVKAALGADLGDFGPENEDDWDAAFEGIGRVAVYAAHNPKWDVDFHWSRWKQQLADITEVTE